MESGRSALAAGTRPHARGCVKTPAFNLRVESSSHLVNLKTKSSGNGCSKRPIEKTVLRCLGSRTFSHGLAPEQPFAVLSCAPRQGTFQTNLRVYCSRTFYVAKF